ncbi:hypothetical protein [Symbiopectobacterium purcellii]|uniref:Uncharacterized protein n=1 Tax=Symbiopectobacterium purcellii TaxID=2871826 RepID=A0ABX9ANS9_9ENTR|nr:hypothetical protein [Symbiopectobacterium purcellii]QZN96408.1 hypothetical protein K6K13_02765 [Symbiopectobacterium purcellii]
MSEQHHSLLFNKADFTLLGSVVSLGCQHKIYLFNKAGSNNINHPHYLMNTQILPGDDSETKEYKLTLAYLTEENKWLKKQVKKLTGIYD